MAETHCFHHDDHRANARFIRWELAWLQEVIEARFATGAPDGDPASPPPLDGSDGPYADALRTLHFGPAERLVLILALAPHLAPDLLDPFLLRNEATGARFSEFGGLTGQAHAGFLPTAETAMFLLAGRDLARRLAYRRLFAPDQRLVTHGVLTLDLRHPDEPPLSAALRPTAVWLETLLSGEEDDPPPGPDFPAQRVTTTLDWDDLVLDTKTLRQVGMIQSWLRHSHTLLHEWNLARRLKPGYRCLFHGPPGTGKTLTACLLGKVHGLPVYRVDLSRIVSKWIGETEKNLGALFDQAQHRKWVLFFDEAESLFGKRTESRSANDRAANQQISYLLQRLEDYSGLAILATNHQSHMDEAFSRRFQSSILFAMPDAEARLRLWRDTFRNEAFSLASDVDFARLAADHEMAGGAIVNVLRHACLLAVERRPPVIRANDLIQGIRAEMQKEGHYLNG
ncbi:MAG TPA: ATP-binding protein [Azospirillaceae bacterium]|nr:ATP-binding protein [Azospirillaceae bacterium]